MNSKKGGGDAASSPNVYQISHKLEVLFPNTSSGLMYTHKHTTLEVKEAWEYM